MFFLDAEDFEALAQSLPQIQINGLNLSENDLKNEALQAMLRLVNSLGALKSLILNTCGITNEGISVIFNSYVITLENISLQMNEFTDEGAQSIIDFVSENVNSLNLKEISIYNNNITKSTDMEFRKELIKHKIVPGGR